MTAAQTPTLTPITRGTKVVIPAGTPIKSTHPTNPAGPSARRQTISASHTFRAFDAPWAAGRVRLPGYVSWAGTGGYWRDARVTPELIAANPDLDFTDLV